MKAQTSTEFVVLVSFMLFVFLVFLILIQGKMADSIAEKNTMRAQDIMDRAVNEIRLAESVSDDYYREFTLPYSPNGFSYDIKILVDASGKAEIILTYDDKELIYFLDAQVNSTSVIGRGTNNITKRNGVIVVQKMP
ncbi:MAG: hypothetical protein ACP5NV_05465 [Candidatus Woesearchaeota archaeon]